MMRRFSALLLATATFIAAPALLATAQEAPQDASTSVSMCGNRIDIVGALSKEFKEAPMAVGVVDQSAVLEVFVSDGGTWTIIASRTDGSSCVVSSGEGWQSQTMVIGKDA